MGKQGASSPRSKDNTASARRVKGSVAGGLAREPLTLRDGVVRTLARGLLLRFAAGSL